MYSYYLIFITANKYFDSYKLVLTNYKPALLRSKVCFCRISDVTV